MDLGDTLIPCQHYENFPLLASKSPIEKSLYGLLLSKACPMLLIFAQINADGKLLPSKSSHLASSQLQTNDKRPLIL